MNNYPLLPIERYRTSYAKNWGWFLLLGIVLVVLGVVAIGAATFTTLVSIMLLGSLLFVGGIFVIIDTCKFWWRKWDGFFLHLAMGILYLLAGFTLLSNPLLGSMSLTLLFGVVYTLVGLFRIIHSLTSRLIGWGWWLFSGLISLMLGILIIANWPEASLYLIGMFVGIDLIFVGWAYVTIALGAKTLSLNK